MGNSGTTPSWDEEQIAKYGIFAHFDLITRQSRARNAIEEKRLIAKHIGSVLPLLPESSEETIARASAAITQVAVVLTMLEITMPNWKQSIASDVHKDWVRRTEQSETSDFYALSDEDQQPFIQIVEIVVAALEKSDS